MARWLVLFLLIFSCLVLGVVVGSKLALHVSATPTPPLAASPAAPNISPTTENPYKFVIVLVNDTDLGSKSTLQMAWIATISTAPGPLQIALAPLPLENLKVLRGEPWLLENGLLNPAILTQLFHTAAPQFRFVVFDLEALTDLLQRVGQVPLPQEDDACQAEACLGWVYTPGLDQAAVQRRLQEAAEGILHWVQESPSERSAAFLQWVLENQGRGHLKTDIAPEYWSQWAGQAHQQGIEIIH